jgi:3-methylcrotonyl-CoA carboxylase alpha subunit
LPVAEPGGAVCAALALRHAVVTPGAWGAADGFRLNGSSGFAVVLQRDDEEVEVCLRAAAVDIGGRALSLQDAVVNGEQVSCRLDGQVLNAAVKLSDDAAFVMRGGDTERFRLPRFDVAEMAASAGGAERITAPMPGQVITLSVAPGDAVESGQVLLVIEAMKMEHTVTAPRAGTVAEVSCAVGDRVDDGMELVTLES